MAQPSQGNISSTPHSVNRLTVEVTTSYEDFRARYEEAVPHLQTERFAQLVAERANWDTVREATKANAPHDFIIYWSQDLSPLMRLAGHQRPCMEYLMGNHVIAEQMYAHDPAVLLYAPLRTAIYDDAEGTTRFTVDQPSTVFSSFGNSEITKFGLLLDRELAGLLAYLEATVPAELASDDGR